MCPVIWESASFRKLGMSGNKMQAYLRIYLMCPDSFTTFTQRTQSVFLTAVFCLHRALRAFEPRFQNDTNIHQHSFNCPITNSNSPQHSLRGYANSIQFPTWSTMTWILKVPLSYSLVFQTFQQPTLTCHVSHVSWQRGQRASSAFLRLGSAASCAKTVALVDGPCLQSVPRDNTLIMCQRHKPQIPEHIQTCSCSSSPSACAVGGDPDVLVVLIPSYSKNISEKIRKYGRSAFRIATMKLPPIWGVWECLKIGDAR